MTISITINGNTTTQTAPPNGSFMNVPASQIGNYGCTTNPVFVSSCPNSANKYNDWVYYDYKNLPCGVPISFTIISGNTVFTDDCGGMYPVTVNFTIPCPPPPIGTDVHVCAGQPSQPINIPATATWTNSNPGIGLPASGVGPIPSFVPQGGPGTTATITYNSGCGSGSFNIIVDPAPTANFSTSFSLSGQGNSGCLYETVSFTDLSLPYPGGGGTITSWQWDFGDGNTSTQQNPTHQYTTPGTYTVTLTVQESGSANCPGIYQTQITLYPVPTAAFTVADICQNIAAQFVDQSTVAAPSTISGWNWNVGNGLFTSTQQNPSYNFSSYGTFPINLQVSTNHGCTATTSGSITVYEVPQASFTTNDICVVNAAQFINTSSYNSGTPNYYWDFGDGNTSSQQSPSHLYANAGTYSVKLKVVGTFGCADSITQNINVYPQPSPSFTYSGTMCENFPVTFTNTTPAIPNNTLYWFWDMGDQTPVQTTQNVTHTYANPAYGPFNVKLKVSTNYGCSDSVTVPVYINEVPDPAFTTQNICIYEQAQFNNQTVFNSNPAILHYAWDFGDGNTSTQTSPSHSYNPFGMYTVKLVAYTDSGCADSVTHNIYVSPQPVADFTVADDCRDVPAQFTDQSTVASPHSIVGWNWDFGVNPPAGSTQQNPSYLYPNNGTFNVTLIVTSDSGCTDTITKPTVRYAVPVANFSFTEVCEYDSAIFASTSTINNPGVITQFIWNFGDGSPLVNIQNPKHKYSQCGPYNVTLIVSSANGCVDDTTRTINIHDQPLADFIADTVCVNGPVTSFTDLSTVQCGDVVNGWQWDFNPGMSNLQNPVHDYNQDGYFPVTLIATSSFGCKDTVTKNIRVYEKPQAAFTADTTAYCHPYCTQFTDISTSASTGIVSWDWNFYNGETSQSAMPMICFENESAVLPKYYDVRLIVSNGYGCYDTIVKKNFITVWPKPLADFTFGPQPTDIYESEIDFDNLSIGGDYFTWNFGDGNMSNLIEPMHLYADSGNYLVTLYIENDWGCSDTVSKPLRIEPDFAVFIPNAFTPDGDGDNETFFLKGYGIVEDDFQFMIFNRWGDMIYYTEKFEPWDGKVDGKLAPQGVYIYRIILKDIFDVKHEYIGNVNLIR
ncbi:MAG: hypothetical protein KatS3mg034_0180 [Vicingaceae bacterium]|nr:MAG: hypothetical protein KatS3mg034_0180 [Vicingaceae bacterium]